MKPLLLIQTGEAPEPVRARCGGFADWFRSAMRLAPAQMRVARVDTGGALPAPDEVAGAVITGSGAMVTDRLPWSEATAAWIRNAVDTGTPLFGVCYGHQLMAHALGGKVGWLPAGREIGTQPITRTATADASDLGPLPASFPAQTSHRQAVLEPPRGTAVLASSPLDRNHLLRYGPNAWSSQFHPEFSADAMRAYIQTRAAALGKEGLDPAALAHAVHPTESARALLERFAHTALARRAAVA